MKVIFTVVTSLDDRVTDAKGRPPNEWASREDQVMFRKLIRKCKVVIMGGQTYEAQKASIRKSRGALRIVMTRRPGRYKKDAIPGRLEFTSDTPIALLVRLKRNGFKQVLLAGGPKLANVFFKAGLVDEIWITREPVRFGKGLRMPRMKEGRMSLIHSKQLNKKGTVLSKYKISN